jgi:hypothetical protein
MGVKNALKKVAGAIAWPFAQLFHAILSPRGYELLGQAAELALATPLGKLVAAVVEEIENVKTGEDGWAKHQAAFEKIVAEAMKLNLAYTKWAINILIELAVGVLKKKLVSLVNAPPAEP